MKKNILILTLVLLGIVSCKNEAEKPNIIVILADDMGYSDLGCMGGEIQTPNLDNLANDGLLFTHCYNSSRCAPSRASLLTGLYQHRTGIGHMLSDWGIPSYRGFLNDNCITIAEILKENGYNTIISGKWHVGDKREHWPDKRGFDNFFGTPKGGGLYFYPSKFIDRPIFRNGKQIFPDSTTFYTTDNYTTEAIQFITESQSDDKPFFLYLAYIAPHYPLQAWPEDIAKYKGKYDQGYEAIRQTRFEKQQKLGIVDKNIKLSPPEYPEWNTVNQQEEADRMEVYAAMVDRMDQNIGHLVDHLKSIGEYENTLLLFLSDNGACAENVNRAPEAELGTVRSFTAYGKNWANVGNTPYRKYKSKEHEGGILTPLIVHWPAGITKNRLVKDIVHIIDIMPTCLEITGAEYPNEYKGKPIKALDGQSFSAAFQNKKIDAIRPLFWEHEGNQAVRINDWKLVKLNKKPWELYELKSDPTELDDLSETKMEVKDSLLIRWNKWANATGVESWPVRKKKITHQQD